MKSNHFGKYFGFTTFGESHGKCIGLVIEDIKPNIEFPFKQIQSALNRRKPGTNKISSSRQEKDKLIVLSGIFEGKTTGMPICMIVNNEDIKSVDYEQIKNIFRPGHADYSYFKKFKIYDYRGGGRSSGRETIARVTAAGVVEQTVDGIEIISYPIQIGKFKANQLNFELKNDLNWLDSTNYNDLKKYLNQIKKEGSSVGGIVQVEIKNIPAGLGDPVFEKLEANLAKAILSIGSVKGIEFGKGFLLANLTGKESNDEISSSGFLSNNMGGILGGISTGQDIIFRFVVKPTPSIALNQKTIDHKNNDVEIEINGRHDICIVPRILPVAEAMTKLVLADAIAHQKLITSEKLTLLDYREAIDKIDEDILIALYRRLEISAQIGKLKKKNNIAMEDISREEKLLVILYQKGQEFGLESEFIQSIWKTLFKESKKHQ
ncbi:MAG: chorismate synthase [Candidatus Cloacimonetes bacterium]|nr:chorismate synthase [Candidatus Cloacimonadota bacterium]